MREYTITYDDGKTVRVTGRDAENARTNFKKAFPESKIKSTKIFKKLASHQS